MFVGDGLVGQIDGQRVACFFFRALEKFLDLLFGERRGQDAIFETIVVENVRVAWRDDHAKSIVFHSPRSVLPAGAAAEVGARQQNGSPFVARKIRSEERRGGKEGRSRWTPYH